MEKLKKDTVGGSLNIVQDNIEKLKTLFPVIVTEGKIDFEILRDLLGDIVETAEERYNFTWHGKTRARRIAQTPSTGTLRPCQAESKHWDATQNLFIEGDNLEVLKLLQKSYHKQVKMIYIDPPYNTGKEFIYPDNYQDNLDTYLRYTGQKDAEGRKFGTNAETSGRYHTNWLNMMYPRLKLARNLLRDDGVIFISIDDNEVANLRKLCDEIFGEENFVSTIVWEKRYSPQNAVKWFSESHDFVMVYAKNKLNWYPNLLERSDEMNARYRNLDNDPRGVWKPENLTAQAGHGTASQFYVLTAPNGKQHTLPNGRCWLYTEPVFQQMIKDNRIWFGADGNNVPAVKRFLSEVKQGTACQTIWKYADVGHNQEGKKEINELFPESSVFDTPKPSRLIKRILMIATDKNDIILDFFSGSATAAHAVMDLNAQDGGNRKFIVMQLPEACDEKSEAHKAGLKTIADIGKERIRRAGEKILQNNADKEGIENLDIGFKVFKLDSSNIKPWDADFDNLEDTLLNAVDNIKDDRSEDDVLYEILLKYGLDLSIPIEARRIAGKTVYSVGFGALVLCLDDAITLDAVEGIGQLKKELAPEVMRVVFKDSGFADDVVKTNAIQTLKKHGIDDVKSL
jgi:adenine-specific DNA-methyltransferase